EFVFRHNRRRTPMAAFQTLLGLGTAHEPSTYAEITGRAAA
ncbi:MAG TPA: IS1595 family transposase, partial [Solirubrobacterales bacterium]|nr:IS1595 family transposase [Solirubrobacterales bacterium]HMJ74226.1 IS1595 family transposase [Solirubrobacterales bacterium]